MGATAAVIGAGMAGLACARRLQAAGLAVRVFDKGRGPGGRMATRRVETPLGEARFDHGAQFFTARDPHFRAVVDGLIAAGAVRDWSGRLVSIDADGAAQPLPPDARFVGAPGMNAVVRALAEGLAVAWGVRVDSVAREGGAWRLAGEGGLILGRFDLLVCAIPAEQAAPLLAKAAPRLAEEAAGARTSPCWAGLYALDAPLAASFDGAKLSSGPIAWAARDRSKPGRTGPETWVLHASPGWSAQHLEDDADGVAGDLWAAFERMLDLALPTPVFRSAHRWRYAQAVKPAARAVAFDPALQVGACGDWRIGPRVECAWQAGDQLAAAIITGSPTGS